MTTDMVYIVFEGDWDNRGTVKAVFTDEALARGYADHADHRWYDDFTVTHNIPEWYTIYHMTASADARNFDEITTWRIQEWEIVSDNPSKAKSSCTAMQASYSLSGRKAWVDNNIRAVGLNKAAVQKAFDRELAAARKAVKDWKDTPVMERRQT